MLIYLWFGILGHPNNTIDTTQKTTCSTMTLQRQFDLLPVLIRKTFLWLTLVYPLRKPLTQKGLPDRPCWWCCRCTANVGSTWQNRSATKTKPPRVIEKNVVREHRRQCGSLAGRSFETIAPEVKSSKENEGERGIHPRDWLLMKGSFFTYTAHSEESIVATLSRVVC